jgi:hypothetical protein
MLAGIQEGAVMRFAYECRRRAAALAAVSQESSQFQFQAQALAIAEMWLTIAAIHEGRTKVSDLEQTAPSDGVQVSRRDAG